MDGAFPNQRLTVYPSGAPKDTPTIVSRLVTGDYWQHQCALYFPQEGPYTFGSSPTHSPPLTVNDVNAVTDGWFISTASRPATRLIWTNGQYDPWRTSGVSSQFRPGGPLQSTSTTPLQIIPGGFHCSDLILTDAAANEGVQRVVDNEVKQIVEWVAEYYHHHR